MKTTLKNTLNIILFVMCSISLLVLMGCSWINSTGYKTFEIDKKVYKFSFEYPSGYNLDTYFSQDLIYSNISLSLPWKSYRHQNPEPGAKIGEMVNWQHTPGFFEILVWGNSKSFTTAKEELDNDLIKRESAWESFNLLERSQILVSGVDCESALFTDSVLALNPDNPIKYYKRVYFKNMDSFYIIRFECESDLFEQVSQDFQHVLDTFHLY